MRFVVTKKIIIFAVPKGHSGKIWLLATTEKNAKMCFRKSLNPSRAGDSECGLSEHPSFPGCFF